MASQSLACSCVVVNREGAEHTRGLGHALFKSYFRQDAGVTIPVTVSSVDIKYTKYVRNMYSSEVRGLPDVIKSITKLCLFLMPKCGVRHKTVARHQKYVDPQLFSGRS